MKKNLYWAVLLLIICGSANAQMDNLANLSARWIRSNIRNAALDGGGDMVNFNPAGLALLDDGLYLSLSNQTVFRYPNHSYDLAFDAEGEKSFEHDGIDPILPMFYAAYKKNSWAVSSGVYISGGGGSINYPDGSINSHLLVFSMIAPIIGPENVQYVEQSLEASSYYLTVPLAFSYALNEKLSLSAGARYIRGINKTKATIAFAPADYSIDVDYKTTANGFGGVFGIDFRPMEKLNFAIHYETKVKLEFEAEDNKGSFQFEADGTKSRRDLPAVLNIGTTYAVTEKLMAGVDFNWYFQSGADWGKITDPRTAYEKDASDAAGDCYTLNGGATYDVTEKLQLSLGCSYTAFMYDDQELYYTKMGVYETNKNNNFNVGIGAGFKATENITIDLGLGRTFWKDKTVNSLLAGGTPVEVGNKAYVLALGFDFKF